MSFREMVERFLYLKEMREYIRKAIRATQNTEEYQRLMKTHNMITREFNELRSNRYVEQCVAFY